MAHQKAQTIFSDISQICTIQSQNKQIVAMAYFDMKII